MILSDSWFQERCASLPGGDETLEMLDRYIQGCDGVIHLVGDMTGAMARPLSMAAIATPGDRAPRDELYQCDAVQQALQQAHLACLSGVSRHPGTSFSGDDHVAAEVLLVSAGSVEALNRNLAGLCNQAALDLPEQDITEEAAQRQVVLQWLQAHPGWPLILDNVDRPEAAAELETLLPQLSGRVVLTARLRNWRAAVQLQEVGVLTPEDAGEPQGSGDGWEAISQLESFSLLNRSAEAPPSRCTDWCSRWAASGSSRTKTNRTNGNTP